MTPFEGAKSEREDAQRALLEAVANAGRAGKDAFTQARAEVERARTAALDRAAQRAALTGQNLGGADTSPALDTADRFGSFYAGQEAAGQQHLQNIGASGSSYLAKVGAIAPFMQQKAVDAAADRDNQYRMDVAANQSQIDAQKAQRLQDHQWQLERMQKQNVLDMAKANASASAKAAAAKPVTPQLPKLEELMAGAQTATDLQHSATPNNRLIDTHPQLSEVLMSAADKSAYNKTDYKTEVAKALGESGFNLTPTQINTIFYKSDTKADQDAAATSLSKKYSNKGVNYQLAQSVLGNEDFQRDVQNILSGADGRSREEVDAILRQYYTVDRPWHSEYVVLAGEYLGLLPTQAQLDNLAEG